MSVGIPRVPAPWWSLADDANGTEYILVWSSLMLSLGLCFLVGVGDTSLQMSRFAAVVAGAWSHRCSLFCLMSRLLGVLRSGSPKWHRGCTGRLSILFTVGAA